MVSSKLSTQLFGAFLLGHVVWAAPSPADAAPTQDIEFGEAVAPFKIFGDTGKPALKHIEEAMPIAFSDKNADGTGQWLSILLGFTKCSQDWPMTWYPTREEAEVFPAGQAASLPVDPKDQKRHEKFASLASMALSAKLVPEFDFKSLQDKAWWPWALLEGVQAVSADQSKLDFASSITALSGYETVTLEGEQLADSDALLKNVYSNAIKSPVWMQYAENGNFSVALNTEEHSFELVGGGIMTNVTYLRFPVATDVTDDSSFDMTKLVKRSTQVEYLDPVRIVHLKDFPYFKVGEPRVVEWARENPDEKLKPQA